MGLILCDRVDPFVMDSSPPPTHMRISLALLAFFVHVFGLGQEWTQLTSGTTTHLSDIAFGGSSTGVAVGVGNTIISSSNAGNSWTPRTVNTPVVHLKGVAFSSPNVAWIVGDHETVLKSVDGGVNWTVISSNGPMHYYDIHFSSPQVGYIVGGLGIEGVVKRTIDGGATWTTTPVSMEMYAVHANASGHAWACGSRGVIHHTANGVDWEQQADAGPDMSHNVFNIFMLNDAEGWVGGSYQTIHHTVNGGDVWDETPSGTNAGVTGIYFSDGQHGWAITTASIIGGYPIRRTTDGTNWVEQNMYLPSLNRMHFLNPSLGWVVGDHGTILRYGDGTVAMEEHADRLELMILPNPVRDRLIFRSEDAVKEVIIINTAGMEVSRSGTYSRGADVSTLAPGCYMARVATDKGWRMGRFIKE